MPQAMPLTTKIRQGATKVRKQRILEAKFGDGYGQRIANGLNPLYDTWQNFGWDALTQTELNTVMTAFDAVGSVDYLTWTPTGETAKKFVISTDGVQITPKDGIYYAVLLTLVEIK